ncbi:MAG: hypothetical protein ACK4GM_08105 [Tabrizicola sp.]
MASDVAQCDLAEGLAHLARPRFLWPLTVTPGCMGHDFVGAVGWARAGVPRQLRILKRAGVCMPAAH